MLRQTLLCLGTESAGPLSLLPLSQPLPAYSDLITLVFVFWSVWLLPLPETGLETGGVITFYFKIVKRTDANSINISLSIDLINHLVNQVVF